MSKGLSYKDSGVDIDVADATKRDMARALETTNTRVLNRIGAFASLFDAHFPGYKHPVLVLKTEEPGSKQKLAFQNGRVESICYDMINHLINDIIVMGATPLSVQDAVICGKLEKDVVTKIVESISKACAEQECVLTGGETSEQPGVLDAGLYILTSSIVGVVDKADIIDGSKIRKGDVLLAIASNGLHTNGYSLVRALMHKRPEILESKIQGEKFLDAILKPHLCYYKGVKPFFKNPGLHGLAHITGGGIAGNLNRIIPESLVAQVDLSKVQVLPLFTLIKEMGQVPDEDMLRTFNMGTGLFMVLSAECLGVVQESLSKMGYTNFVCGEIVAAAPGQEGREVQFVGQLKY